MGDETVTSVEAALDQMYLLRLNIGGDWSAGDFAGLFTALNRFNLIISTRLVNLQHRKGRYMARYEVARVQYASPGVVELLSIHEHALALARFISERLRWKESAATRSLVYEEKRIDLDLKRIELARELLQLSDALSPGDHRIAERAVSEILLSMNSIEQLVDSDKIVGVDMTGEYARYAPADGE